MCHYDNFSLCRVVMVVADGLVPIWRQGICNNHADIGQSVRLRSTQPNVVVKVSLEINTTRLHCESIELSTRNAQIRAKSSIFRPAWPCNLTDDLGETTGHLFHATSSVVHHFKTIGEFKLELQSGKFQFGSNFASFFYQCDLEIWRMTLKTSKRTLQCRFKFCASLRSHPRIQIRVSVRKRSVRVKSGDFCPVWPWNLTNDLEKQ